MLRDQKDQRRDEVAVHVALQALQVQCQRYFG
jgi:hypothetical protein